MKKIIAFAGSNSKNSINKQLALYAVSFLEDIEATVLDLNNFELPIYSIDYENEQGIPKNAYKFLEYIKNSDGIILSLAEHNGAYTAAFKNSFDWMSRIDGKLWNDKPMLLMATSPGGRGGATVLEIAKGRFPYMGGNIKAEFLLPNFYDNFKGRNIVDEKVNNRFRETVAAFKKSI